MPSVLRTYLTVGCLLLVAAGLGGQTAPVDEAEKERLLSESKKYRQEAVLALLKEDLKEVIANLTKVYELEKRALGDSDPKLNGTLELLAEYQEKQADFPGLVRTRKEQEALLGRVYGPKHRHTRNMVWQGVLAGLKGKLTPQERKELAGLDGQLNVAMQLNKDGKHAEAIAKVEKLLERTNQLLGEDNPDYAFQLYILGSIERDGGRKEKAARHFEQSLKINQHWMGEEDFFTVMSKWNLGGVLRDLNDFPRAEPLMLDAIKHARTLEKEKAFNPSTMFIMVRSLGVFYIDEQNPRAAQPLLEEALTRTTALDGKKGINYSNCLRNLGHVHRMKYELKRAEQLLDQSLEAAADAVGKNHPEYGFSLKEMASIYWEMGLYRDAEDLLKEALGIFKARGENDWDYLDAENTLGLVYIAWGFPEKSAPLFIHASTTYKQLGRRTNHAATLHNIGLMYLETGDYVESEKSYLEALKIKQELRGKDHVDCAITLEGLGGVYEGVGDFTRAEKVFLEALRIRQKAAGENEVMLLPSYHELGALYLQVRDYARAEPYLRKTLELREKYEGKRHPTYAKSLDNLAKYYHETNDVETAIKLMKDAMEIREAVLSPRHPDYATGLNNLASLLVEAQLYEQALANFEQAAAIIKDAKGEDHPDRAVALTNAGDCYRNLKKPDRADTIYKEALALFERFRAKNTLGRSHPEEATVLRKLAWLARDRKDLESARKLIDKALSVRQEVFGKDHVECAMFFQDRAIILANVGKMTEALVAIDRALELQYRSLRNVFSYATEEGMEKYLEDSDHSFHLLLTFLADHPMASPEERQLALRWSIRRKGIILDTLCRYREAGTLMARDAQVASQTHELRGIREQMVTATVNPSTDSSREEFETKLGRMKERAEVLETALNRRLSANIGFQEEQASIDLVAIRKNLPPGAVLVEFVRFAPVDLEAPSYEKGWRDTIYVAFVIAQDGSLRLVPLGEAELIDEDVKELRQMFTNAKGDLAATGEDRLEKVYRELAEKVYDRLLGKLDALIKDAGALVLIPDGDLHLVPFGTLVHPKDGKYLIERCPIVYLSSGRDLLRTPRKIGDGIVVFAGPDYDLSAKNRAELASKLATAAPVPGLSRGPASRDGTTGWKPLAGARAEAEDIKTFADTGKFGAVIPYVGRDALEEALKAVRSPRILHLATHGFYYPAQKPTPGVPLVGVGVGSRLLLSQDPLYRSGIVLAGANTWREKTPEGTRLEDGWVTAEEVALLDLAGTDLVVLSACEAGLGDVKGSEGVYGLRRAFLYAGTRSLVTTLFAVPDAETRKLMAAFYRHLASGKSKMEALHQAQLDILKSRREKGAAHPYFWGGFILVGEAGN